jgi:cytoskeleton protein RodZ
MDTTIVVADDINSIMNNPEPVRKTGLGARLKATREALQLTEKEAAARLHLNVNIISIIENENFADAPPATFIRGYLRSYARLLNISENEIKLTLKELESAIPSSCTITPALKQIQPVHYSEHHLRWLTSLIIVILVILVSLWWRSHSGYAITDLPTKISMPSATPLQTSPLQSSVASMPPTPVKSVIASPTPAPLAQPPAPAAPLLPPNAIKPLSTAKMRQSIPQAANF